MSHAKNTEMHDDGIIILAEGERYFLRVIHFCLIFFHPNRPPTLAFQATAPFYLARAKFWEVTIWHLLFLDTKLPLLGWVTFGKHTRVISG
jgi:hypothetical protein